MVNRFCTSSTLQQLSRSHARDASDIVLRYDTTVIRQPVAMRSALKARDMAPARDGDSAVLCEQ